MNSRTKKIFIGIAALIFLVSVIGVISVIGFIISFADTEPHPGSFTHEISYEFSIEANSTLRNVTFLVPFPEDQKFAKGFPNSSENTTFSNEFNGTTELVELNNTKMLQIETDKLKPRINSNDITAPIELSYTKRYNRSLNTSEGLEKEASVPVKNRSDYRRSSCNGRKCFSSTTEIYAEYQTGNSTEVSTSLDLEGWNEWFTTAWSGNQYRQHFSTGYYSGNYLFGSQSSWIKLVGEEVEGDGVYRD